MNFNRIRTSHGVDSTQSMIAEWVVSARHVYASVSHTHEEGEQLEGGQDPLAMTEERYVQQVQLRQEGLDQARKLGVDYLLVSGL